MVSLTAGTPAFSVHPLESGVRGPLTSAVDTWNINHDLHALHPGLQVFSICIIKWPSARIALRRTGPFSGKRIWMAIDLGRYCPQKRSIVWRWFSWSNKQPSTPHNNSHCDRVLSRINCLQRWFQLASIVYQLWPRWSLMENLGRSSSLFWGSPGERIWQVL